MKSIGSLISSVFKDLGMEERVKLELMRKEWNNLFNGPLSVHTYPVELKDKELLINVDSPVWLGQLKFFKQDIIGKLHSYNIKEIRFKHGYVYSKAWSSVSSNNPTRYSNAISDSDIRWIDQITTEIEDNELGEAIRKAIRKGMTKACLKLKR